MVTIKMTIGIICAVGTGALIHHFISFIVSKLLNKSDKIIKENDNLIELRDIDILSSTEYEKIVELFNNEKFRKENYEKYQEYANVLYELKVTGYFTEEQYNSKIDKLKKHFKFV